MPNLKYDKKIRVPSRSLIALVAILALCCFAGWCVPGVAASGLKADEFQPNPAAPGSVIVQPKFGGEILGYAIDPNGTQGLLSEAAALGGGLNLVATEIFDQTTGAIVKVVKKENDTQDDFVTQGIFGDLGLVLFQHLGRNHFLTINPFSAGKFTGKWTPPVKPTFQVESISANQGTTNVAAYQSSFTAFQTFVFSSNIAANTFGPQISLAPIMNVNEFFLPLIALDTKTNQAVLADSLGCPEQVCTTDIALVNLTTGKIIKFTAGLGIGTVDGLAVDSATGIACTTTLIDQGVEFYNLAKRTGFEVQIPNAGSALQAGLDVAFDPIHHVFLVEQYSSNGNPNDPQPRIYVYDEKGNVQETINVLQRIPVSPSPIALNPGQRIGFLPVIVEPQHMFLELQSFTY
jgi:hypothetical protein